MILSYEEFLEASLPHEFGLNILGTNYLIKRVYHLRKHRDGDHKPKDFKMTKNKYERLFTRLFIDVDVPLDKSFTVTWNFNNKSNSISFSKSNNKIEVFGAIMNSLDREDELYKKAQLRYSLGEFDI